MRLLNKMKQYNKGLEFATTFFVILALGIVMILLAFAFFKEGFSSTDNIIRQIDQSMQTEINKLLSDSDAQFIVPIYEKELKIGETYTFGAGLRNNLENANFQIHMVYDYSEDYSGNRIDSVQISSSEFLFDDYGTYYLKKNQKELINIPIRVPENAERNTNYVFKVYATCDLIELSSLCNPYGYEQEIVIKVV